MTLIIIPARSASTRFPNKPLQNLTSRTGKSQPLVLWTWEAAMRVPDIRQCLVATDCDRIAQVVQKAGGEVVMTPDTCQNGTERVAMAAKAHAQPGETVVNFQGDAPLTPPHFVTEIVKALKDRPDWMMTTPVLKTDPVALERFEEDWKRGTPGATTALFDDTGRALCFSKTLLPWGARRKNVTVWHHVGLYACTKEALDLYLNLEPSPWEDAEGLEQLRWLQRGVATGCVPVLPPSKDSVFWEVNTPADVARVEGHL